MPNDEWIKTLEDGRRVKFTSDDLVRGGRFITAQVEGNPVVYSVVLTGLKFPLTREGVEGHFANELSRK